MAHWPIILGVARGTPKPRHHVPPAVVPVNTSVPVVTGTAKVGYTLTLSNGVWSGSPTSFVRRWKANGTIIVGATGTTYDPVVGDVGKVITGEVLASNAVGPALAYATSVATAAVAAADVLVPVNTTIPAVTGTAKVGFTLTLSNGLWTNSPTGFARKWYADAVEIGGATGTTYDPVVGDVGKVITGSVLASNAAGPALSASVSLPTSAVVAADAGTFPGAPLSITAPIVGTPRTVQWGLQGTGVTGPQHAYTRTWNTTYPEVATGTGRWPARPNDPYLQSLGMYYNNYGDLWIPFTWNNPGGSVVIADYDFAGTAPTVSAWGAGCRVTFQHCAGFSFSIGQDINRNPTFSPSEAPAQVKFTYCDMNGTRWDLLSPCDFELGPYNRVRNQAQELGFGGGYLCTIHTGINCHHNYITGGGCNPGLNAHIELWQHKFAAMGTDSYCYVQDNMFDFSKDGQKDPSIAEGWTGVISESGDARLKWNRNIVKGMDIVQYVGGHPPGGMGTVVAYDDFNVLAGFEMIDNAFSYNPNYGPTYKHGGGTLKPIRSGNRWFRDADSALAGVPLVKADNTVLVDADFG